MKKITILPIVLIVISVVLLSGCTGPQDAVEDAGTCCVLGIIGVVLFIILIAYLLGGKKTVVQTQQSAPPPVIIREASEPVIIEKVSKVEKEKVKKPDKKLDDDAIKILRQRYAKGEITKEEYEEMKKALKDE